MKYEGPQIGMGIADFEENTAILSSRKKDLTIAEEMERCLFHEKFHGNTKPGCCLVKKKREVICNEGNNHNYVDIYACIFCDVECLRSGWEIGWYGGTNSRDL